jgi:type VI secretion system protein VasD
MPVKLSNPTRLLLARRALLLAPVAALALALSGCASDGPLAKTAEFLGLKTPQSPEDLKAAAEKVPQPKKVTLRVHAGDQLNTDAQSRSLSVVMRVYKLRRTTAFLAAPYSAFGDTATEKTAFGDDIVEVREVVMRPGQKHEVVETMPLDGFYIAVAALFRAPSEGRWRFAFDAKQAEQSGITLGLHGCAISVAAGTPEQTPPEWLRLAGVQCR